MLPFPKRPGHPDEMALGTGDYEALPPPMASRQPVFPRSYPMRPLGMQHGSPEIMTSPGAPNSLAPMAMASVRGSNTSRAQETVVIRGRPDLRMGVVIALAGAIIGGTLGVAMNNAKRADAQARADRAAAAAPALPPTQATQAIPMAGTQVPTQVNAYGAAPVAPGVATTQAPVVGPFTTLPQTAFSPVAVAPSAKAEKAEKAEKAGKSGGARPSVRGGGGGGGGHVNVAAAVPSPPPVKAAKPSKPSGGGGGGSTEADLLREAIKEGGQSLGGSN